MSKRKYVVGDKFTISLNQGDKDIIDFLNNNSLNITQAIKITIRKHIKTNGEGCVLPNKRLPSQAEIEQIILKFLFNSKQPKKIQDLYDIVAIKFNLGEKELNLRYAKTNDKIVHKTVRFAVLSLKKKKLIYYVDRGIVEIYKDIKNNLSLANLLELNENYTQTIKSFYINNLIQNNKKED